MGGKTKKKRSNSLASDMSTTSVGTSSSEGVHRIFVCPYVKADTVQLDEWFKVISEEADRTRLQFCLYRDEEGRDIARFHKPGNMLCKKCMHTSSYAAYMKKKGESLRDPIEISPGSSSLPDEVMSTSLEAAKNTEVPVTEPVVPNCNDGVPTSSPEETAEMETQQVKPMPKPKPITVSGIDDPIKFSAKLDSFTDASYEISARSRFIKIYPSTLDDKAKILTVFKAHNVPHYITEDRVPLFKIVIRGLFRDSNTNDIYSKLTELGFEVIRISQMISKRDGKPLPLFLVQMPKSKKSREILNLRTLFKIRIEVELFRPQKKATQCFKCQNFHHIAANCFMQPRCVVCGQDHESSTCPVKLNPEKPKELVKCCNCEGNHPSSYKGCKNYPLRIQTKKSYADTAKTTISKKAKAPPPYPYPS